MSPTEQNILAVILARAGSKGLPGKNFKNLLGKPVIAWTIEAALAAQRANKIVLTTDAPQARTLCADYGITMIDRPAELATDDARVDDVLRHAVQTMQHTHGYQADIIALLYANVPVRAPGIIDKVVDKLTETTADSVQTFCPVGKFHPYWLYELHGDHAHKHIDNAVHRRQDLPAVYAIDGAAAAVRSQSLMAADGNPDPHAFWGNDRRGVVQPAEVTVDIDSLRDFYLAQATLRTQMDANG